MIILFYLTIVFYFVARAASFFQHDTFRKYWQKFFYLCCIIAGLLATPFLLISLWDQIKAAIH